jgi:hypothetical protein
MEQTKYDFGNLRIVMDDALQADLEKRGVQVREIFRLVENFGNKLLMEKATGEIDFTNKTTGAALKLEVTWESDISAVVEIKEVILGVGKKIAA